MWLCCGQYLLLICVKHFVFTSSVTLYLTGTVCSKCKKVHRVLYPWLYNKTNCPAQTGLTILCRVLLGFGVCWWGHELGRTSGECQWSWWSPCGSGLWWPGGSWTGCLWGEAGFPWWPRRGCHSPGKWVAHIWIMLLCWSGCFVVTERFKKIIVKW